MGITFSDKLVLPGMHVVVKTIFVSLYNILYIVVKNHNRKLKESKNGSC